MMTMTRKKLMFLLFTIGFVVYSYSQIKDKLDLAKHIGISENQLEITSLCIVLPFSILLAIAVMYYAKKFKTSPTDFGYSLLLGGIISVILGSLVL